MICLHLHDGTVAPGSQIIDKEAFLAGVEKEVTERALCTIDAGHCHHPRRRVTDLPVADNNRQQGTTLWGFCLKKNLHCSPLCSPTHFYQTLLAYPQREEMEWDLKTLICQVHKLASKPSNMLLWVGDLKICGEYLESSSLTCLMPRNSWSVSW